jgi:hypothetical protein
MAIVYDLVAADWTVDSATGNIRYIGHDHNGVSPSYATVIELHRWLQELADDQVPADTSDEVYISMLNPSVRSTDNIITLINGYNVDAAAVEHLYDGSIIQSGGDEIWDGIVNFGNANVQIQIIQDGAVIADDYWNYNVGAACDATDATGATMTDSGETWVLNEYAGYTIVNTTDLCKGIVASNTTGGVATFRSTGELHLGTNDYFTSGDNYLIGVPLNPDAGNGISHRFMIKVREDGCDIDGRKLIGICRRLGNTYAEFVINSTTRGNNVLALVDSQDLNFDEQPQTVIGTTWDTDFSGEDLGFQQFDVDDDATNEDYYGKYTWTGTHDINDLYQRVMGETEDGSGYTVHGLNGEVVRGVTHSVGYDNELGGIAISDYDMLTWGTYINTGVVTGGPFTVGEVITDNPYSSFKARVLSVDTVDTSLVVDIEEGTLGTAADIIGVSSGATATTSADPTEVTGGGVLHVLAHDATNDILYVQVIKGTMASAENDTLYYAGTDLSAADHTDTCDIALGVAPLTARTISTPIIGVSTGTAIIGSYGFGIDDAKLSDTDKVTALDGLVYVPPLTVTNTVTGLVVGEDYLLIAPTDGTTVDPNSDPTVGRAFFTIKTALTGATETQVYVNEDLADADIDAWLPATGYIDIVNDEGIVVTHPYSAYDTGTDFFTITSYDFSGSGVNDSVSVGNQAFVGQMHLTTALVGAAEVSAVVNQIIGSTPDTGTIRIINDEGFHIRHPYSAYVDATDTFTITSYNFSGSGLNDSAAIGNTVYVTYIDKLAAATSETFQAVYDNDLELTLLVRDGGDAGDNLPIKQDIKRWAFGNANASLGVTRTSDT